MRSPEGPAGAQGQGLVPRGLLAAQSLPPEQLQALRGAEAAIGSPTVQQRRAGPAVQLQPQRLHVGPGGAATAGALIRGNTWNIGTAGLEQLGCQNSPYKGRVKPTLRLNTVNT